MPRQEFTRSVAFEKSVDLLLRLHLEMKNGDPDGNKADSIRNESEKPWYEMSVAEQEMINGLSEDLYTIDNPWPSPAAPPTDDLSQSFEAAQANQNFAELLSKLRNRQREFAPDQAAFIRGLAWLDMGFPAIAVEFFEEAVRLSPTDLASLHLLLCVLTTEGRTEDAMRHANRVDESINDPAVVLYAADAYFQKSSEADIGVDETLARQGYRLAQHGIRLAGQDPSDETLRFQCAHIRLWLALYYEGQNRTQDADRELEAARSLGGNEIELNYVASSIQRNRQSNRWSLLAQSFGSHESAGRRHAGRADFQERRWLSKHLFPRTPASRANTA